VEKRRRMMARLVYMASMIVAMGGDQYAGNALIVAGGTGYLRCSEKLRTLRHPYSFRDVYPDYRRCDLDSFSELQYHDLFRFDKPSVITILNYMKRFWNVPEVVHVPYRYKGQHRYYVYDLGEMFLMVVNYMAVPIRQIEVAERFGRTPAEVSRAITYFHEMFYDISKSFLQNENQPWFTERVARKCARATRRRGCPLRNCCGFVDGTLRKLCNPGVAWLQNALYNGHKRAVGLTWVAAGLPNGMCLLNLGPCLGRRHDAACAADKGLYEKLEHLATFNGFEGLFGSDSAFPTYMPVVPTFGPAMTQAQAAWNLRMNRTRIAIEWQFGVEIQQFSGLDWKQRHKLLAAPVYQWYLNGCFLTNLHNIAFPNLISQHFGLKPPTYEQYFGVPPGSLR